MPKWRNFTQVIKKKPFKYPRPGEPGYRSSGPAGSGTFIVYYRYVGAYLESRIAVGAIVCGDTIDYNSNRNAYALDDSTNGVIRHLDTPFPEDS